MGNMPTYHVTKGSEFGFLSTLFGPPAANFMPAYDAALAQLDPAAGDAATRVRTAAGNRKADPNNPALSANNISHFEKHWLGGPPDGWWHGHPVADVLRAGMREAITYARARSLPMEVLWVCAKDNDFHVYYSESPNQVTVLIFTPPPKEHVNVATPHFPAQLLDQPENIWVVKKQDQYDGAAYQALGGPGSVISAAQPVATVTSGPAQLGDPIIQQRLYHTST